MDGSTATDNILNIPISYPIITVTITIRMPSLDLYLRILVLLNNLCGILSLFLFLFGVFGYYVEADFLFLFLS